MLRFVRHRHIRDPDGNGGLRLNLHRLERRLHGDEFNLPGNNVGGKERYGDVCPRRRNSADAQRVWSDHPDGAFEPCPDLCNPNSDNPYVYLNMTLPNYYLLEKSANV
ncbi:hypothetical protein MBAV_004032 [Candidatus Magnetobacterium bavaricum]|uniref:Uncharacterized protein n=1 Tax=Candidatus Magnetobacterium bavaricum TaxID=29290 RepID=A0A0F3GP92_9BACT|nr:hypothetical protein MBAV_004032 [Candidatus Magnetobacterium bavaricum]